MLQYTNGFSCAVDPAREEIIINFGQQAPVYDAEGNVADIKVEDVVALAMGRSTAERLINSLIELLDDDE